MDIQIVLNWVIQVLVIGFVSFIVIDFVNTVFDACTAAYTATKIQQLHSSSIHQIALPLPTPAPAPIVALTQPTATSEFVPIENPWTAPQFAQLPDP